MKSENEDFFIFVADQTPDYVKASEKVFEVQEDDQSFEMI